MAINQQLKSDLVKAEPHRFRNPFGAHDLIGTISLVKINTVCIAFLTKKVKEKP